MRDERPNSSLWLAQLVPVFLREVVHARFAVVFRASKEEHVKKNGSVMYFETETQGTEQ